MTSPGPSSTHRYPTRRRVTLGEDTGDLPDGPTPPVPPIDHGPEDHYDPHTVEESEADLSEEHEEEPHEPAGSGIPEEDEGGEHTPHRELGIVTRLLTNGGGEFKSVVRKLPGEHNPTDIFTKPLVGARFDALCKLLLEPQHQEK